MNQHDNRQMSSISNLKCEGRGRIPSVALHGVTLAVLALLTSGCSEKQPVYTVKVDCLDVTGPPFTLPLKVFFNGQERGVLNYCEDQIQINGAELQGNDVGAPGVIKTQVLLPEGWTDIGVGVRIPLNSPEKVSVVLMMQPPIRPRIKLYIDNRGSHASEVSVGQWKHPLVRSPYIAYAPTPEKEEAAELRVNDTVLGKLPTTGGSNRARQFLVDVSGERKYELTCVSYGYQACGNGKLLNGKHLHELNVPITYFLERAPDKDTRGTRWELLEVNKN